MPNLRISMSKLRRLIQLQSSNLNVRAMGRALSMSTGAVSKYVTAIREAGLTEEEALALSDPELERRVFGAKSVAAPGRLVPVECAWVYEELRRHRHVTLRLLWEEYRERYGAEQTYRYSAFCDAYRHWAQRLKRSMRQRHFAGEKLFVDFAGPTVPIYGLQAEPVLQASIFVCALGASGYTYAEATRSQSLPDWLGAHVRAFEYYGVPPDLSMTTFLYIFFR